jgi:hypothetical protein
VSLLTKYELWAFGGIGLLLVLILVAVSSPVSYVVNDNVSVSIVSPLEVNGGLAVNVQDQTTPPVLVYLNQVDGNTTLVDPFIIGETIVNVSSTATISVGDYVGIFNVANARFYVGNVLSVSGNAVTMDTPSDFNFSIGDRFQDGTKEMNVDGSVTPQIFGLRADPNLNITVDVTRFIIHILDQTSMDDNKFGGINALTNGIVLRRKDGFYQNIFNVKTNGEFGELAYDKTYDAKAPAGFYGFTSRLTFGGQTKIGVVIRLSPGEDIQLIIQDDLTGLDSFRIMVEGHLVQN